MVTHMEQVKLVRNHFYLKGDFVATTVKVDETNRFIDPSKLLKEIVSSG